MMNRLDQLIEQFDGGNGVINHRELTELVGLLLVESGWSGQTNENLRFILDQADADIASYANDANTVADAKAVKARCEAEITRRFGDDA